MECKYCDTGFPSNYNGDIVCGGCGAEWADAAIPLFDQTKEAARVEQVQKISDISLSAAVEKGLDARIKMIENILGEEFTGSTFEDKQAFVESFKAELDGVVQNTLSSMYEVFTDQVKVYRLNDCDWVAAKSLEDAVTWYQAHIEDDPDAIYDEEEIGNLETLEITLDVMEKDDVDYAIYGHLQEKYFAEGEKTFKVPANEILGIEWCGQPFILCSKEP